MSQTNQVESKSKKVQTKLAYKQTKLNLGRLSIKHTSDDTKPKDTTKPFQDKLQHNPKNDSKQADCAASKKPLVTEIPAIVTSPEIRRVLDAEGVTKIVMDLETSSQGRLIFVSAILRSSKHLTLLLHSWVNIDQIYICALHFATLWISHVL